MTGVCAPSDGAIKDEFLKPPVRGPCKGARAGALLAETCCERASALAEQWFSEARSMRPVAGSVQGTSGDNRGSTHGGAHKRSLAGHALATPLRHEIGAAYRAAPCTH